MLGDKTGAGGTYKPSSKFIPEKKTETQPLLKPPTVNQKPVVGGIIVVLYCTHVC